MIKIQDTTFAHGKAEHYISFQADFERFIKRKFKIKELRAIDPAEIVKKFKLKGLTFGNYVTQEERYFFLFKIEKQLEFLAKLKGNNNLGNGNLTLSFGAQGFGGALAHFSPNENLINLNRGSKSDYKSVLQGESSFIHEYGHYIDFRSGRAEKNSTKNFASQNLDNGRLNALSVIYSDVTNIADLDETYIKKIKHSKYLQKRVEIFARLFEATITHIGHDKYNISKAILDKSYRGSNYYPKAKIYKAGIDKKIIKILKIS